jgi:L-threonylcarbamoyladenylate synthase
MLLPATAEAIAAAADLIRGGDVVAFPTETVYGLGADATNAAAVARIFAIKARPSFDPLIVHIDAVEKLGEIAVAVPAAAQALIARCWPGPLTVVLSKTSRIPDIVSAGLPSVAVRMPEHAVARALIAAAGCPIAAPSANPFGYVSPTTAAHVAAQLGAAVPMILDGGPCRVGLESTIVSFIDSTPTLLRPGAVTLEDLEHVLGAVRVAGPADVPLAPGQLPRHYAPRTPVSIVWSTSEVAPAQRAGAALLAASAPDDAAGFAHVELLSPDGSLQVAAANLFAAMRALDAGGFTRVFALAVPEIGIGRAIMDRLKRATVPPP